MKILYVTTVGTTMGFFPQLIRQLLARGHRVDIACNDSDSPVPQEYRSMGCRVFSICCTRSPLHRGNLTAIRQLRQLVAREGYAIVHCHTPIAAACTRLACRKLPCRVFYTAHGFHFYRGAPLKNWLLFYPVEKLCARYTDLLLVINKEDHALAQKKLRAKQVRYIPGVGIDLDAFTPGDGAALRQALQLPEGNRILLSVGELSHRKNHSLLIRAAAQLPNVTVVIAGEGALRPSLEAQAQALSCDVRLLGRRSDIADLCRMCDLFVLPSLQEGLPVALMEAMACGKAISCSAIRGSTDLADPEGATLFDPHSVDACRDALREALSRDLAAMGRHNRQVVEAFSTAAVLAQMLPLYEA